MRTNYDLCMAGAAQIVLPTIIETPVKLGLREKAKTERKRRIVLAAREQFCQFGYDDATVRGIAEVAEVSVGTLFNYASDKRDLVFMIFNEEMHLLTEKALSKTSPAKCYRENVLLLTDPHYVLFGAEPALSRIVLSQILTEAPGLNLAHYRAIRLKLLKGMEGLVVAAQRSGNIAWKARPKVIARNTFVSFTGALRWWINEPRPDWRKGQRDYAELLDMLLHGLTHDERLPRRANCLAR